MVRAGALTARGTTIRNRYGSSAGDWSRRPLALRVAGPDASLILSDSTVEGEQGMQLVSRARADIVRSTVRGLHATGLSIKYAAKASLADSEVLGERAARMDGDGELAARNTRFSGRSGLLLSSGGRADLSGGSLAARSCCARQIGRAHV